MPSRRWVDAVWLVAFGLLSSAWCLTAAARLGATFDEPIYVKAGLTSWRTGSNKLMMRSGVMTLPPDVQTLPVYLWERIRGVEFDPAADLHAVLPVARAANLVFWWLLLVYAMRLGNTFGGAWGGRVGVALCASDPNLLGHATLATTDTAIVACTLALVYHFWHGLGGGWKRRVLVPGLCYGLAIQAKASGMVFGMEAMLVLGLWHLAQSGKLTPPGSSPSPLAGKGENHAPRPFAGGSGLRSHLAHLWHATYGLRRDLACIALIGFAFVFAYTGSDWGTEPTFIRWAEQLPDGPVKAAMRPVSHNLAIFTNAGEGLLAQVKHNVRGHGTFFLGEWHPRATWKYFPVALTMKVPLAAFALLAAVLMVRPRHLATPVAAVALLLLLLSPNYRVQIGVRFMFTMIALAYIALAVAVARGWAEGGTRCVPRWFVAAIVGVMAATSAWVWPHGLGYFNQLWGGPPAGPELLHDSNCDWGQGLPELKAWAGANGAKTVAVWYYGMDPDVNHPPFTRAFLSHLPHDGTDAGVRKFCGRAQYLAVSVGCLHGHADVTAPHRLALDWARRHEPVARTRYFVIFRLP